MTPNEAQVVEVAGTSSVSASSEELLDAGHPRFRRRLYLVAMVYFVENTAGRPEPKPEAVERLVGESLAQGSSETPF